MRFTTYLLIGMALAIGAAPAWAQLTDNTFDNSEMNNNWNDGQNWSLGVPTFSHNAIVPQGLTAIIFTNDADGEAGAFEIYGTVVLQSSQSLTVKNDSILDGLLHVDGSGSAFVISDNNVTIRSNNDGVIQLSDSGAVVGAADDEVLTITNTCVDDDPDCSIDIRGLGDVSVELVNEGAVVADVAQAFLKLTSAAKRGSGQWSAETGGILSVEIGVVGTGTWLIPTGGENSDISTIEIKTDCLCVEGDVELYDGLFHAFGASFCTTGDLTYKSSGAAPATQVDFWVDAGETFEASGTCPGECE